jgi:23S rRNA pseudouridine1911/1915/1917 synthase
MPLNLLYQDDYLLVIEKSAGVVVTPAESVKEPTISEILQNEYGINVDRGGVVHRLDKDTSGILLAAKSQEVLEALQAQFKERSVEKRYIALVHGFTPKEGTIEGNVGRNPGNREKFTVLDEGREASTDYRVVEFLEMSDEKQQEVFAGFNKIQFRKMSRNSYGKFSLVEAKPKTGRTHQIRVHFKFINHPLVSDEVYTGRKTGRLDKRWCKRHFLHAKYLEFTHPKSEERMKFESPLPMELQNALSYLIPA